MANIVNLDALIPREDFDVDDRSEPDHVKAQTISIRDLERDAFFYSALRKPDFQRETASWSPEKIGDFVKSFLSGDLIPAIILWKAGKDTFVIDGSHRLSALIAWVQDDYGAGDASMKFFENNIPVEQQTAADSTRDIIKRDLGSYSEHKNAPNFPANTKPEVLARSKRLGTLSLQLQWVTGDRAAAEASFFKINQAATPIDKTELRILRARNSPNAIASRAIIRNASGHKYWSKFDVATRTKVEDLGKSIYQTLFLPPLSSPIKTLDVPVAGRGYSAQALPLIFDLVNITNDLQLTDPSKGKNEKILPADTDGGKTIEYLKSTARVVNRISGVHPSSLGLHPAIYFYGANGRYQPTAFLAVVSLIKELEQKNKFADFTRIRNQFENFILANKDFSNQVTLAMGSGVKGYGRLKELYWNVLEGFWVGNTSDKIVENLRTLDDFWFLRPGEERRPKRAPKKGKAFDAETKSEIFLRTALANPVMCSICGSRMHSNSMTFDHVTRKQDEGAGTADNGDVAHPYCNTTYKN